MKGRNPLRGLAAFSSSVQRNCARLSENRVVGEERGGDGAVDKEVGRRRAALAKRRGEGPAVRRRRPSVTHRSPSLTTHAQNEEQADRRDVKAAGGG